MSEKMSAELVERLRRRAAISGTDVNGTPMPTSVLLNSAADHIATLQREADGMREALAPFAKWAGWFDRMRLDDSHVVHGRGNLEGEPPDYILLGDLRRARAALNGSPQVEAEKGSDL